jgi:hypothetical protein
MTDNPVDEIQGPPPPPPVVWWFKVYTGALAFVYLLTAGAGVVMFFLPPNDEYPVEALLIQGVLILAMGLFFLAACLIPLIFRPRPWLWVYDFVIICLGMTSCCCLPACVPLLLFWIKPEVKAYFDAQRA